MRIGSSENSLLIERVGADKTSGWRFSAQVTGSGWMFAGYDQSIQLDTSDEAMKELADFLAGKKQRIELLFTKCGWLRLSRHAGGHVLVRYHVARAEAGSSIQGEVAVSPESTDIFYKELAALW